MVNILEDYLKMLPDMIFLKDERINSIKQTLINAVAKTEDIYIKYTLK